MVQCSNAHKLVLQQRNFARDGSVCAQGSTHFFQAHWRSANTCAVSATRFAEQNAAIANFVSWVFSFHAWVLHATSVKLADFATCALSQLWHWHIGWGLATSWTPQGPAQFELVWGTQGLLIQQMANLFHVPKSARRAVDCIDGRFRRWTMFHWLSKVDQVWLLATSVYPEEVATAAHSFSTNHFWSQNMFTTVRSGVLLSSFYLWTR